jgi:hypothetical protein
MPFLKLTFTTQTAGVLKYKAIGESVGPEGFVVPFIPFYSALVVDCYAMKLLLLCTTIIFWFYGATATSENYEKYIVVLKPNITGTMAESHLTKIQLYSLSPSTSISHIGKLHFYTAHLSQTGIQELANNHSQVVDYFIKDQTFRVQELVQPNPPNWGLSRIDTHSGTDSAFRFPTSAGEGVDIYVLDTGVNAQQTDLVGRVTSAPSFVGDATDASDSNGHGTFVAGICCGKPRHDDECPQLFLNSKCNTLSHRFDIWCCQKIKYNFSKSTYLRR